jgi:hypothetical protein
MLSLWIIPSEIFQFLNISEKKKIKKCNTCYVDVVGDTHHKSKRVIAFWIKYNKIIAKCSKFFPSRMWLINQTKNKYRKEVKK